MDLGWGVDGPCHGGEAERLCISAASASRGESTSRRARSQGARGRGAVTAARLPLRLLLLPLLPVACLLPPARAEQSSTGPLLARLRGGGRGMAFKFDFGVDCGAGAAGGGGGFKFNFGGGDDAGAEPTPEEQKEFSFDDYRTTPEGMVVAREMPADYDKEEELDDMALEALFEDVVFAGRAPMKRATPPNIESMTGPLAEIVDKSDLVPGVYEGGFKVWEGSVDLVDYLIKEKVTLSGLKVMELGCGHAFPGMHAAMEGALVDLQDYNEEVIAEVTMMNVIANLKGVEHQPRYFCGDWGSLSDVTGLHCYDMILTAETIYDSASTLRLITCMQDLLKPEGVAYIAAKSYYFGVGGCTHDFLQQAQKAFPRRTISQVAHIQVSLATPPPLTPFPFSLLLSDSPTFSLGIDARACSCVYCSVVV